MKVFSPRKLDELLRDPRINTSGVAQIARISPTAIWQYRRGKKRPGSDALMALAQALNKPIDYFYEDEELLLQQALPLESKKAVGHG